MVLIEALSLLGLEYDFSEQNLKAAYRKMARKYHPDVVGHDISGNKMAEINQAYEICKAQTGKSKPSQSDEFDRIMKKYDKMFDNIFANVDDKYDKMFAKKFSEMDAFFNKQQR